MERYLPEALYPAHLPALYIDTEEVYAGRVLRCDSGQNLHVDWGGQTGLIPRKEAALPYGGREIKEVSILSLVGKQVCFMVQGAPKSPEAPFPLSRRRAQERAYHYLMEQLRPGQIIPAVVTHLAGFGAFVDLACGISSMLPLERISISRIPHPCKRFAVGQPLHVLVTEVQPEQERIEISHRELLGTWEENAAQFSRGEATVGIVRGVKDYGIFVELTPNLTGLAEPRAGFAAGDTVSVYIKSISPARMKLKLHILEKVPPLESPAPLSYFVREGELTQWRYAPEGSAREGVSFSL